ncbi:MAG: IS110 family transposase [Candidatus Thermoplasmatota archaeon]|jgi:transposase|nr:IS110 family transposase [Candidatus Thermoplasmatota archaeon]
MNEDGSTGEQYEIANAEDSWVTFRIRYLDLRPEIAAEVSTSGKYVARKLRDMGFSVHLADPVKLALIFDTAKKNDREDSYKLAKLLRLGELPEVHLPSRFSDDLRSIVRYRKSLGEEIAMLKNRVHAILARNGILINASDTFGRRGLREIESRSFRVTATERILMSDMLSRISDLMEKGNSIEDQIAGMVNDNDGARLLMTIPGINVYSAACIISEIDDIGRFGSKEKLASYAGLVPRQAQSGSVDRRGHITKHGPSMLRFILVNAAHSVIRYSRRMRSKYLSLVRRVGKYRAVVAIARHLLEVIYTMLTGRVEFMDSIDSLTEKKKAAMSARSRNPHRIRELEESIRILR